MQDLQYESSTTMSGVSGQRLKELPNRSRTSYTLKQVRKPWQDQGLNSNHLKARKCSSFVSFAVQRFLL